MRINSSRQNKSGGFAVVEACLVLVIIGAIVGIGYYVINQKNQANKTVSSSTLTTDGNTANPASAGTSASIDQLTQADAKSETSASTAADSQIQAQLSNVNSANSSVAGAYNENNL